MVCVLITTPKLVWVNPIGHSTLDLKNSSTGLSFNIKWWWWLYKKLIPSFDFLISQKLTFWFKGAECLDLTYSILLISSYMHRLSVIRLFFHLCHQRRERERERTRERDRGRQSEREHRQPTNFFLEVTPTWSLQCLMPYGPSPTSTSVRGLMLWDLQLCWWQSSWTKQSDCFSWVIRRHRGWPYH